ncbi:hypothetical protein SH611_02735 [Geminicoccaceae bacterium 1502E]|nr:hypothetical protein [Geminicoccaceae bacterium 1502E]
MKSWHPVTRLLVVVGALGIPYLLWTGAEDPPVSAPVSPVARSDSAGQGDGGEAPPTGMPELPPLEAFTALVERPLFSPSRRPPPAPATKAAPATATAEPEEIGEPDFQLVGTVTRKEQVFALVLPEDGGSVRWLGEGDELDGWIIVEVGQNHLVVRQDDEVWRLDILR